MNRRAARVDDNQAEIVNALRGDDCSVEDLSGVGHGCPDLLVGLVNAKGERINLAIECKNGDKVPSARRLTPDQCQWHIAWRGQVAVVNSAAEALALVAEVRNA